jgi:biopolymer transport protein ExbB
MRRLAVKCRPQNNNSAARAERRKGHGENALFAIIQAAGWPIWFLLFASIVAVALIIERAVSLRRRKIIPPALFEQVVSVYRRQGVDDQILDRLAKDSPLGTVLAAGLRNQKSSRYVMKEAIEEAGRAVAHERPLRRCWDCSAR